MPDVVSPVFGASRYRVMRRDGSVMHAEGRLGDGVLMMGGVAEGPPAHLHLYRADAAHARALEAGAEEVQAMAEQGDGDRRGGVRDPSGTTWWIARQL